MNILGWLLMAPPILAAIGVLVFASIVDWRALVAAVSFAAAVVALLFMFVFGLSMVLGGAS